MIAALLLATLPAAVPSLPAFSMPRTSDRAADIRAAGGDVAKILALAKAWESAGEEDAARAAYERVLEIDPKHEAAHKALRHHFYDGRWFTTYVELYQHKKKEDDAMAKKGLARFEDRWVPVGDLPLLRIGWRKDEVNGWASPKTLARLAHEKEMREKGWQQQDLTWIPPPEFDRWRNQQWKCDQSWLDVGDANGFHSEIATWWTAPSTHFVVYSTCNREDVEWAKWYADQTFDDLVRIFGVKPGEKPSTLDLLGEKRNLPVLVVFRNIDQYNLFAAGDPAAQRAPTEVDGFSSLHYAYFAEGWFDATVAPPQYHGAGVAFWDRADERLAPFGQHSIRHAAAQSFAEAIDPTFDLGSDDTGGQFTTASFWGRKRIPKWLRYGAASYVERYFLDATVAEGGNPRWSREWALQNVKEKGGLGALDDVFAFRLSLDQIDESARLIHRAGLLVTYILDGEDAAVTAAHESWKKELAEGGDMQAASAKLQAALHASETKIKQFAGL